MKPLYYLSILLLSTIVDSQTTTAQDRQDFIPGLTGTGIANYRFAEPGDFTMLVSVWGVVRASGRYEIPVGTDIGQLLSLAGGPGADVRGFEGPALDRTRRDGGGKTIVRLSRLQGEGREIIMELRIEDLLRLKEQSIPLQDGDIVMIDQVRPFRFWDALAVTSSLAAIILLIDRFVPIFGD